MNIKELKKQAKENHIKNWWKMNKAQLEEALKQPRPRSKYKEQCDGCGKWDVVDEYDGKLLCDDCIEKAEAAKVDEVRDKSLPKLVPMPVNRKAEKEYVKKFPEYKKVIKGRKMIEYMGKSQHIVAWARELGMNANTLYNRIYYKGMTMEEAVNAPVKKGRPKKEGK